MNTSTSTNGTSGDRSNPKSKRPAKTEARAEDNVGAEAGADAPAAADAPANEQKAAQPAPHDKPLRDPRTGPVVAFLTAAVVFAIGQSLIPTKRSPRKPIVTAAAPAAPASPAEPESVPTPAPVAPPAPVAAAAPVAARSSQPARSNLAEKDVAREAWRKNLPDISEDDRRASLLIPIRGSIEGATYHLIEKSRGVVVNLPRAESMITMPFYRLKEAPFKTLWIKQDQGEPTNIRLMLGKDVIKPEVEFKDGFVRFTVTKTAP